ncbi:MAG: phosphatidate cytidylyltransferase, partial [Alphaproteobacteria bacterium]
MTAGDQWGDLRVRVVSATVLIVLGCVEVWLGGTFFRVAVVVVFAVMVWELAGLAAPPGSVTQLGL